MVPSNISYDSVLDRHGGGGGIPDPTHLETISNDLKTLAQLAGSRSDANTKGMRDLSDRRKQVLEEERDREREQARLEAEESRKNIKKEADEEEKSNRKVEKSGKKDRSATREERPPARGAHGLARQDGLDLPLDGTCLYFPDVCPCASLLALQIINQGTLLLHCMNSIIPFCHDVCYTKDLLGETTSVYTRRA